MRGRYRQGANIPLLCEQDKGGCCGCIVTLILALFIVAMCGGLFHH